MTDHEVGVAQISVPESHQLRPPWAPRIRVRSWKLNRKLTLAGRCLVLFVGEIIINVLLWICALLMWTKSNQQGEGGRGGLLALALIGWTLGLRHGLDMDHIVCIDNVTRNLVSLGQRPVTVGLFFSLGHSTIVVATTIAIIASTDVISRLSGVGSIGAVIGVSISASFLLILAIINSVLLHQALRKRRVPMQRSENNEKGLLSTAESEGGLMANSCISRLVRPLFKAIDRPYKLYPVGILFGLGFDTASEIALLGISALARTSSGTVDTHIPTSQILVLPLLFTAGMTLVDSLDSIFMIHAYSIRYPSASSQLATDPLVNVRWWKRIKIFEEREEEICAVTKEEPEEWKNPIEADQLMSISIILTILSIGMALLISIIEFMGLAASECDTCAYAAENDEGLSGKWWRFWRDVNDNSGFLGVGIVSIFILVIGGWSVRRYWVSRRKKTTEEVQ